MNDVMYKIARAYRCLLALMMAIMMVFTVKPALAANQTFGSGSYVIDMGVQPQTIANGLRPYGLLQDLVINNQIPVAWVINPAKARDGIDFSHNGRDFRGGPFVIAAEYAAQAAPVIQSWVSNKGLDAAVVVSTTAPINVPVYETVTVFPRAVLDADNGSIAAAYLLNAGIDSSFYRVDLPSGLNSCDDVYTMPHADPQWATHQGLIDFNNRGGSIWAACHAVSVLENVDDPADADLSSDMNFLSSNGLVDYGDHADGTPPYSYRSAAHPIMQFMGSIDFATQNGSEQIYLPGGDGWRPTTTVVAWDSDHPEVGAGLASPGEAAAMAFGRGFGNSQNGVVMYEGGHSHSKGDNPQSVAAQRAYLNFLLMAGLERRPLITSSIPTAVKSLEVKQLDATVVGGDGPYAYAWRSDCGGSFSNPFAPNPIFTAPATDVNLTCILRVTVSDTCIRRSFSAGAVTILGKPNLAISKTDSHDPAATNGTLIYTLDVVNNGGDASAVMVTDTLPAQVGYVSAAPSVGSCNETAGTLSCDLGLLASGASASVAVTVTLPAAATLISNTASVSSADGDLDPADNVATETTRVLPEIDLALSKAVTPASVGAGDRATYALSVTNRDPALSVTNVLVTDVLPDGLRFEEAVGSAWNCNYAPSTRALTCLLASLSANTSATVDVVVTALDGGTHRNTARVQSLDFAERNSGDNTASVALEVVTAADLAIIKTTNKLNAADGNTLVFSLDVSNTGGDAANDVVVTDTLRYSEDRNTAAGYYAFYDFSNYAFTFPDGTRIQGGNTTRAVTHKGLTIAVDYDPATSGALNSADPVPPPADGTPVQISWTLSQGLAAGESIRLEFEAKKESDEQAPNTAAVSSTTTDPRPGNNTDTIQVGKQASGVSAQYADLQVLKAAAQNPLATDDPLNLVGQIVAGAPLSYVVSVRNNGPQNIPRGDAIKGYSSITLVDTLPLGTTYLGFRELGAEKIAHTLPDGKLTTAVKRGTWDCSYAAASRELSCAYTLDQGDNLDAGAHAEDLLIDVTASGSLGVLRNTVDRLSFTVPPAVNSDTWLDPYDHNDRSSWDVSILPAEVDLAVSKSVDNAAPVAPGDTVSFTVTVDNTNAAYPAAADSVVINDPLPDGLTLLSRSLSQGAYSGDDWLLGDLAYGASATMTVTASVDSIGLLTNSATLRSLAQDDVVAANNTASASVDVPDADLAVVKTVGDASPNLGERVTFTISLSNNGPLAATGILVTDQLATGLGIEDPLTAISADTGSVSYDSQSREISWALPALANQAVATLSVTARVNQSGDLLNTARIAASDLADGEPANNESTVLVEVQSAELALTKQVDIAIPGLGDTVEFTVNVVNNGPRDASGLQVTDRLPAGLAYLSHSTVNGSYASGTGLWDIGALANGAVATLSVQARVEQLGSLVNSAAITAVLQPDPNPNNDAASVNVLAGGEADIYMTKSVDKREPFLGEYVTFTIEAINYGPDPATSVVIRDALPGGVEFDSATLSHGSYDPLSGDWDLGGAGLAVGEIASLQLRVKVTSAGIITNAAGVFSAVPADPDLVGNEASVSIRVPAGVNVSGTVWSDADHNRRRDAGESGIGDVTVVLYGVTSAVCQSVKTAADGSFRFAGVAAGAYRLIEAAGETVPLPGACVPSPQDPAGYVSTTTNMRLLSVTTVDVLEQDFGDFHGSRVTGRVFEDNGRGGGTAHDGSVNGTEAGLSGVSVEAHNASALGSTTTDAEGRFTLWLGDAVSGGNVDIRALTTDALVAISKSDGGVGDTAPVTAMNQISWAPVSGQSYSAMAFGAVREPALAPDHSRSAMPGSSVHYPHTFTAHTSGTLGVTTPSLVASPQMDAWSAVLYQDSDCSGTLEVGEPLHTAPLAMSVDANSQLCLIVKVFVPANAPQGAQYAVSVSASFDYSDSSATKSIRTRTDLTTVALSGLALTKVVDKATARPGESLIYTITYTNTANAPMAKIVIDDKTPAFTTFSSANCVLPLPANLSGCAATTQPPLGGTGAIQWTFDSGTTLQPGGAGQVRYEVTVDN